MVKMVPRGFTATADAYLTPHIMRSACFHNNASFLASRSPMLWQFAHVLTPNQHCQAPTLWIEAGAEADCGTSGISRHSREASTKAWSMFSCPSCSRMEDYRLCRLSPATKLSSLAQQEGELPCAPRAMSFFKLETGSYPIECIRPLA